MFLAGDDTTPEILFLRGRNFMNTPPTKYKLTGDAKRLWKQMEHDYGSVLKERHKPLMFALCQQWELYLNLMDKLKRCSQRRVKDASEERRIHLRANNALKSFHALSKDFQTGINDQLQFTVPDEIKPVKKTEKLKPSRLGQLLSGEQLTGENN